MDTENTKPPNDEVQEIPVLQELDFSDIEPAASAAKVAVGDAVKIAKKLQHVLKVYPGLNISMIQVGMGISIKAPQWRPIFNWMKTKGYIREENLFAVNPAMQNRSYNKYFLVDDASPNSTAGESTLHVAA